MTRESTRRSFGRDAVAGLLLCGALVLPWNLYLGLGIPGSDRRLFAVLAAATVLSLASIGIRRLRVTLNTPYLLLVCAAVVFDVVQTVRYGGTDHPPGGVGPGAFLGVAGALLAARIESRPRTVRFLGFAAMIGAGASALFNLYWRVRYALPDPHSGDGFGRQHVAIIATAVVYAAVAWVTVYAGARWIVHADSRSRIATVVLGVSTLGAGVLVWLLPAGRIIDGFHGIAQNTSTAGVGFEGYLAWAAAAAIFLVPVLRGSPAPAWLDATGNTLLLIVVWCVGSALMRITDLVVAVTLHLPYSPYDSATMAAFDLVAAVIAIWLRINLSNRSLPAAAIWSVSAVLLGFTIARIMVGVGLAPRLADPQRSAALTHPVYGNGLAQQITSTFDVVLCGLALYGLAVAIVVGRLPRRRRARPKPGAAGSPRIFRSADTTVRIPVGGPRIYRGEVDSAGDEADPAPE
ncbi:hypothetical protein KIH27_12470 [Mycobacterium sp. M1]|uniref:DUF7937 domain-containing protein n=1 Tax=Mycolicibacter acidiphilus TaxID=2835306 RepID=A0ABS5RLD2_9MYCO|nr:hypothetical protein [Mycolicibacter acidiphilus]MBS9534399.1 hypothetical protein [Mycolicibacter acidiphilus]